MLVYIICYRVDWEKEFSKINVSSNSFSFYKVYKWMILIYKVYLIVR